MADIKHIADNARHYLEADGWLADFEHGYDQGDAVREILQALGYLDVMTDSKDYGGNDTSHFGTLSTLVSVLDKTPIKEIKGIIMYEGLKHFHLLTVGLSALLYCQFATRL